MIVAQVSVVVVGVQQCESRDRIDDLAHPAHPVVGREALECAAIEVGLLHACKPAEIVILEILRDVALLQPAEFSGSSPIRMPPARQIVVCPGCRLARFDAAQRFARDRRTRKCSPGQRVLLLRHFSKRVVQVGPISLVGIARGRLLAARIEVDERGRGRAPVAARNNGLLFQVAEVVVLKWKPPRPGIEDFDDFALAVDVSGSSAGRRPVTVSDEIIPL